MQDTIIKTTDSLSNTTEYTYNKTDNLINIKNKKGSITRYEYTPTGRLYKTIDPTHNITQYEYNPVGNLVRVINIQGTIQYTYDKNSGLTKVIDDKGRIVQYSYNPIGNKITMTDPEEGITGYTYNELNQLINLKNPLNEETTYIYYPNGQLKSKTFSNGITTTYYYDTSGRLTKITHPPLPEITYTYDKTRNRLSLTIGTQTTSYQYDSLYRLTKVIYSDGSSQAYTYDSVGNRLTMNAITYSYNQADQLIQAGTITYSYDKNGNLIKKDGTSYVYDYENRLTQITFPDKSTETFTYCPLGKRMAKNNSIFLYDDFDLIAEYDPEGTLNARYTFGPGIDNPISVRIGTQSYFYHLDGLGSVIFITDKDKNIVSSYTYDAFGLLFPNSEPRTPNPFLFTSREYEPKSNLYYYRARYYDPEVGRFITKDPFTWGPDDLRILRNLEWKDWVITTGVIFPNLQHPYVYCLNNPVNYVDPDGKMASIVRTIIENSLQYKILGRSLIWRLEQIEDSKCKIERVK